MSTNTVTEAQQPGDITLTGRALENAQPGHPNQRQTVFEVARAVKGRATSEIERAIAGIAAEAIDFGSHTPSSQPAVRDAYKAVAAALGKLDSTIETTARTAVATAENRDMYPLGRADAIDQGVHQADGGIEDAAHTVTGAADTLRAVLEGEALPQVPTDPTPALATLQTLMNSASDSDKPQLFDRLASRDDALAGWLLGGDGAEYARSLWGDAGAARHQAARLRALQAALERGNKHARAARAVADLQSAAGAYRASWKTIRGNLVGLSNDLRRQAEPKQ
jgi:hypothetical protein